MYFGTKKCVCCYFDFINVVRTTQNVILNLSVIINVKVDDKVYIKEHILFCNAMFTVKCKLVHTLLKTSNLQWHNMDVF